MRRICTRIAAAILVSTLTVGVASARQIPARQPLPGHDAAAGEDRRALSASGPLQGNWRIVRANDPADAAIMRLQIIQDGARLEGSYVLFQPFCSIEQPLPVPGVDECELIDLGADIVSGRVNGRRASVILRPGADALDHRLSFRTRPTAGPLNGRYYAPGDRTGVPVVLERALD